MTIMDDAARRLTNSKFKSIIENEHIKLSTILKGVSEGHLVIPNNINRESQPIAIGNSVSTKINLPLIPPASQNYESHELEKVKLAEEYGVHVITDSNTNDNFLDFRRKIFETTNIPIASTPMQQACNIARKNHGSTRDVTEDHMLKAIENQAKEGVDMIIIQASLTKETLNTLLKSPRKLPTETHAGAHIAAYMSDNGVENPFYTNFDYILEILYEHDVILALASSLRPSCLADSTDVVQLKEDIMVGKLALRARQAHVQTIIGGQGFSKINLIPPNTISKELIGQQTPIFTTGPMVTDIAPGYGDVVSAIGATVAAMSGVNLIRCCPGHNSPNESELVRTRKAIVYAKIAAHIADLKNNKPGHWDLELEMADAKNKNDISRQKELSLDPMAAALTLENPSRQTFEGCGRCTDRCAIKYFKETITE